MSNVVLGEELGAAGNGALTLALLADCLAGAGYAPRLALRDITQSLSRVALPSPTQAPIWRGPPHYRTNQIGRAAARIGGMADVLAIQGMAQPAIIGAMVAAWREILARFEPDFVIGYAAPALAIACAAEGTPFAMVGDMHAIPPSVDGSLPRHDILQPPIAREADIVGAFNAVREELGQPQISSVSDVLGSQSALVFGHGALDMYVAARPAPLLGSIEVTGAPSLAEEPGLKAVGLLSIAQDDVEDFVFGILACHVPCAIHVHGAPPAMVHYLEQAGAWASFRDALDQVANARVVIHQAEAEVSVRAALAGVPHLLLPASRAETKHLAGRLAELGCGEIVPSKGHPIQAMERAVRDAWSDTERLTVCRTRAAEFATTGPLPGAAAVLEVVERATGRTQ